MRKLVVVAMLLVAGLAQAATPSEGVPLQVRRGFFTDLGFGGIVDFGGYDGYSNLSTYLHLGLGYSIPVSVTQSGSLIDIGLHVGIGANAQNCYATRNKAGDCVGVSSATTSVADNFTMTFLNVTGAFLFGLAERLYLGPKILVGYTLLDPPPDESGTRGGITGGAGLGIEYATNMDHFSIGLDVLGRLIIGPDQLITSLQFFGRVKYTF